MKKTGVVFTFLLILCVSVGYAKKIAALPQLANPITIDINEDELYVLDEVAVYVYSLKDYRLLRKFGKKGEGQGQLMPNTEVPLGMNISNGSVFLNSQIKMIQFSKKGEIIKEQRIPFSLQTIPFGKNFVSIRIGIKNDLNSFGVILYDADFNMLKKLYSRERIHSARRGKLSLPPELIIIRSIEDRLFILDQKRGFNISTFDLQGNPLNEIKMDYQRIKMTDSFKKVAEVWFRTQPSFQMATEELREMIYFPEYLPILRNFIVKNKKIYTQTYKTQNHLSEFFILDFAGKLIKQKFFPDFKKFPIQFCPSNIFTIYNEKYYYLAEGEIEWEIHMEELK